MIFALTALTESGSEERKFEVKHYFYGYDKKDALRRYKEIYGSHWDTSGFYGIDELSKEDGRIILKKFKKKFKKVNLHVDIYSQHLEYLRENTSIENIKIEEQVLKLQKKNVEKLLKLEKEAKHLNIKEM